MSPYVNQNSCDNCDHKISVMQAPRPFGRLSNISSDVRDAWISPRIRSASNAEKLHVPDDELRRKPCFSKKKSRFQQVTVDSKI